MAEHQNVKMSFFFRSFEAIFSGCHATLPLESVAWHYERRLGRRLAKIRPVRWMWVQSGASNYLSCSDIILCKILFTFWRSKWKFAKLNKKKLQNRHTCNVKGQSRNGKKIERERPAGKNVSLFIIHNYFQTDLDFSFTGERLSNFSL